MNLKALGSRLAASPIPEAIADELRRRLEGASDGEAQRVARALDLPWTPATGGDVALADVQAALTERWRLTHEAARRISEHVAVAAERGGGTAAPAFREPLCIAAPTGIDRVGIADAIAHALNRPVAHVALPRLPSAAALLGQEGAPGALLRALQRAGSPAAVVILEDIDRLGSEWGPDPYGFVHALSDSGQRGSFRDPYFDIPYDLGGTMVIVTARWTHGLPEAVRSRLDVVEVAGFTDGDRVALAQNVLLPALLADYDIAAETLEFADDAIEALARAYTLEPGVAALEALARRVIRRVISDRAGGVTDVPDTVTVETLGTMLGRPSPTLRRPLERGRPGVVGSLVVDEAGGAFEPTQAVTMSGNGRLIITDSRGADLSSRLRLIGSVVRARLAELAISARNLEEFDTHIRVPASGLPGDEDAVGVAAAVALVSLLRDAATDPELAATGRLDLLGRVSAVDGIEHKMLAAHRAGVRRVVLPRGNERALDHLPPQLHDDITFIPVEDLSQALQVALR